MEMNDNFSMFWDYRTVKFLLHEPKLTTVQSNGLQQLERLRWKP